MPATVVLIGFPRHSATLDAFCLELGLEATAAACVASTCPLPAWQSGGPDLVLLNGAAAGIDVGDAALTLSRMHCTAGIVVCGVTCPRVRDTLAIMMRSMGLCGTCADGPALAVATLRQAVGQVEALRRAQRARPARPAPEPGLAEIGAGLARSEFSLYYQPKVSLIDGSLSGVEALLRWRHPRHGLLTPASFLHRTEAGGMAGVLTAMVLQCCLRDVRAWAAEGFHPEVSVNLSPQALSDPDLADRMLGAIRASGLPPSQLSFEITEYAEIADLGAALRNLLKLRMNGHALSLDDYGAGHGSILQLSRIPFDEIKVDMRLIQGAWQRPHLEPLLSQAVSTAQAMGMRCVAEGIETPEEWEHVRMLGFDLGQGYLIGRPAPAASLAGWRFAAGYSTDTNEAG